MTDNDAEHNSNKISSRSQKQTGLYENFMIEFPRHSDQTITSVDTNLMNNKTSQLAEEERIIF